MVDETLKKNEDSENYQAGTDKDKIEKQKETTKRSQVKQEEKGKTNEKGGGVGSRCGTLVKQSK